MSAKDDQIIHLRAVLDLALQMLRDANQHRYADYLQIIAQSAPTAAIVHKAAKRFKG